MEIGMSAAFPSNVGIVYLAYDPTLTQLGLELLVDTCKLRLFYSPPHTHRTVYIWESS